MEEESDTRKINNSFLRDHNYATEGIFFNVLIDGGDREFTGRVEINEETRLQLEGRSRCCDKCAGYNIEINISYEMLSSRVEEKTLFFLFRCCSVLQSFFLI